MPELALHILDILQNSLRAGATLVTLLFARRGNFLRVTVSDNGAGMEPAFMEKAADPFTTTRTTRHIGLGLPLYKAAAEATGGGFWLESVPGKGTTVTAEFDATHLDCPPLGDLNATVQAEIATNPDVDFIYQWDVEGITASLDTRELRKVLQEVPLNNSDVQAWIRDMLAEEFPQAAKQ